MSLKSKKAKLWKLVSEYSRRKDADGDYGQCCCCGKTISWKYEGDAGHFVPKSKGEFWRWELDNIHLQCKPCNSPRSSNLHETAKIKYTRYMENRYGKEYVDYLLDESDKRRHYKESDYDDMIEVIEAKLEELE